MNYFDCHLSGCPELRKIPDVAGAGRCGGWVARRFDISGVYLPEKHVEVLSCGLGQWFGSEALGELSEQMVGPNPEFLSASVHLGGV